MSRILTALEKDQAQGSLLGTPKQRPKCFLCIIGRAENSNSQTGMQSWASISVQFTYSRG